MARRFTLFGERHWLDLFPSGAVKFEFVHLVPNRQISFSAKARKLVSADEDKNERDERGDEGDKGGKGDEGEEGEGWDKGTKKMQKRKNNYKFIIYLKIE